MATSVVMRSHPRFTKAPSFDAKLNVPHLMYDEYTPTFKRQSFSACQSWPGSPTWKHGEQGKSFSDCIHANGTLVNHPVGVMSTIEKKTSDQNLDPLSLLHQVSEQMSGMSSSPSSTIQMDVRSMTSMRMQENVQVSPSTPAVKSDTSKSIRSPAGRTTPQHAAIPLQTSAVWLHNPNQMPPTVEQSSVMMMQEKLQMVQHGLPQHQQISVASQTQVIMTSPLQTTALNSLVSQPAANALSTSVSNITIATVQQEMVHVQPGNLMHQDSTVAPVQNPVGVGLGAGLKETVIKGSELMSPVTLSIQPSLLTSMPKTSASNPTFLPMTVAAPSPNIQPHIIQPSPIFSHPQSALILPSLPPMATQAASVVVSQAGIRPVPLTLPTKNPPRPEVNNRKKKVEKARKRTKMVPIAPKPAVTPDQHTSGKHLQQGCSRIFLHPDPAQINMINQTPLPNSWNLVTLPLQSPSNKSTHGNGSLSDDGSMKGRQMMRLHGNNSNKVEVGGIVKKAKYSETQTPFTKSSTISSSETQSMSDSSSMQDSLSCSEQSSSDIETRRRRFLRTREALEKSGLMDITMQTASLIKSNWLLGNEIEALQKETANLINALMNGDEYRCIPRDQTDADLTNLNPAPTQQTAQLTCHYNQFDRQSIQI